MQSMRMLDHLCCDVTAVLMGLRASRGLLAIAVLTVAGAIGMNAAMVGLVDRALLSPPRHVAAPEELFVAAFEGEMDGRVFRMTTTSYPAFQQLRDDVPSIKAAAAWQAGPSAVVIDGKQVEARTVLVSAGYFDLLRTPSHIGNATAPAGPAGVVISHAFWTGTFGRDPGVVGRRVVVRGTEFHVSAVMPRGFSGHSPEAADAWIPIEEALRGTPDWDSPYRNIVSLIARLSPPEVPAAEAQAAAVVSRRVAFLPLAGTSVGEQEKRIALWLLGLSAIVLVIGLANAGTLLIVRAAKRRRESAIRAALGAGRGRLLLHLTGESILVALAATAASVVLAYWLDEAVRRILLPGVVEQEVFDPPTLIAAIAAGTTAALIALAVGAAHLPSSRRADELKPIGRSSVLLQRGLLVVQAAVSVLLLACAGMFGRSLHGLLNQEFGFTTDGVLLADFEQGAGALADETRIFTTALQRIRELPGIESATVYQAMPFGAFHVPPIAVPGRSEPPSVGGQLPFLLAATPEFFEILDIRIVEGRGLTTRDERGTPVVVVNETMARTIWPGQSAVGKCIRIGFDPDFDPYTASGPPMPSAAVACREIVGVARDVRQRSVVPEGNEAGLMQYYVPFSQVPPPPAAVGIGPGIDGILVKIRDGSGSMTESLRAALTNGRADLPPARIRPYATLLERQVKSWQMGATLLALFSAMAVSVAGVGLYAAFAHAVVMRRREIAIRIAIGATPSAVRGLIFRDAALLTFAAAIAGCVGAVIAGRSLQSVLYGIVAADPVVLGGATAIMIAVALCATLLPARAAARCDPNALLQAE